MSAMPSRTLFDRRESLDQSMILEDGRDAATVTLHRGGRIERAKIRKHNLSALRRYQTVKQVNKSGLAGAGSPYDDGYPPCGNFD